MKRTEAPLKFLAAFLLLLSLAACDYGLPKDQQHFAKAYRAYQRGDFYTAILYLKPLVEEGRSPASQLLLSKMYANGQGVPVDMGKAELLRNLAAAKMYQRPLPPGKLAPGNATLQSLQDRIDYYAEGGAVNDKKSVHDISQLLSSLDTASIKQISANDFETGTPVPVDIAPSTDSSLEVQLPAPELEAPKMVKPKTPSNTAVLPAAVEVLQDERTRNSNQISLAMIRKAAGEGDPLAMDILSSAFARGHYGLKPDAQKSAAWRKKAMTARQSASPLPENYGEPEDDLPVQKMCWIILSGLTLVIMGFWLGHRRRKRS